MSKLLTKVLIPALWIAVAPFTAVSVLISPQWLLPSYIQERWWLASCRVSIMRRDVFLPPRLCLHALWEGRVSRILPSPWSFRSVLVSARPVAILECFRNRSVRVLNVLFLLLFQTVADQIAGPASRFLTRLHNFEGSGSRNASKWTSNNWSIRTGLGSVCRPTILSRPAGKRLTSEDGTRVSRVALSRALFLQLGGDREIERTTLCSFFVLGRRR